MIIPNIATLAKSQVFLPSNETFILFYDTENSLHLTGAKNEGNELTFFDYESNTNGFSEQGVQTIGVIPQIITLTIPEGYKVVVSEHKITGLNLAGTLAYAEQLFALKTPGGILATTSPVVGNDFATASVVISYPTPTTIQFTITGELGETINWVIQTNLSPQ